MDVVFPPAVLTTSAVTMDATLLTPLQLETLFWGQNYLDLVQGEVRGL